MEKIDMHESVLMDDTHKFLPNGSDQNLEQDEKKNKIQFNGLTKEQVMSTANDPFWVRMRWALLILFWVVWFSMLIAAGVIVYVTPKCPPIPKQPWWEKEIAYQVDVTNFKDSNGDGVGDLKGLLEKIEYLRDEVGVRTLCLSSSIFDSKSESYRDISPNILGDATFNEFRKSLKTNDMHLIIDLPYKATKNELSPVDFWLNNADGVRITNIEKPLDDSKFFARWTDLAASVSAKTFETKFIGFHPVELSQLDSSKSSGFFHSFTTAKSPDTLKKISSIYNDNSKLWPLLLTNYQNQSFEGTDTSEKNVKITHGFALLLKGTPFILYGDEINLKSSDNKRIMKWDSSFNCGFSRNNTELIQECSKNIEEELSHGAENTLIRMYKSLSELRKQNSFLFGQVKLGNVESEQIIYFSREATGFPGYIVAANVGDVQKSVNLKTTLDVPDKAEVVYFDSFENKKNNDFEIKKTVLTKGILLKPGEFIVLSYSRS